MQIILFVKYKRWNISLFCDTPALIVLLITTFFNSIL